MSEDVTAIHSVTLAGTTVSSTVLSFETHANIGILQAYALLTASAVKPDLSKYPKLMLITSTFLSTASKIPLAIIDVGANPLSFSTLNIFIFIFCGVLSTMTLHTAVP